MKHFLKIWILLILTSCTNVKTYFTNGEWIYSKIYLNDSKTDSMVINSHLKFLDNGDIMLDKYTLWNKYKIEGKKFYFIQADTVSSSYDIITATDSKIELQAYCPIKTDKEDTTIYRKLVFIKTNSLPDKPYDSFLFELAKHWDIGKPDSLGDETIFYSIDAKKYDNDYKVIYDNPFKSEHLIKGIMDKSLGILPKSEKIEEFSEWCRCIQSSYEWETLNMIIKMQNDFLEDTDKQSYLNSRIWITEK